MDLGRKDVGCAMLCCQRLQSINDHETQLLGVNDLLTISQLSTAEHEWFKYIRGQDRRKIQPALVQLVRGTLETNALEDAIAGLAAYMELMKTEDGIRGVDEAFLPLVPKLITAESSMSVKLNCIRVIRYSAINVSSAKVIMSFPPLFSILESYSKMICEQNDIVHLRNFAETINQLINAANDIRVDRRDMPKFILTMISRLLYVEDTQVLMPTLSTIQYVTNKKIDTFDCVFDLGLWGRVMELLSHSDREVQLLALRCVGEAASGEPELTQQVVDWNAISILHSLLETANGPKMRKEICWIFSNISAGTDEQLEAMLAANALPCVLRVAKQENDFENDCLNEVGWVLANIAESSKFDVFVRCIDQNFVEVLTKLLYNPKATALKVILEACATILKVYQRQNLEIFKEFCSLCEQTGLHARVAELAINPSRNIAEKVESVLQYLSY